VDFFATIRDGVWIQHPSWMTQTKLTPSDAPNTWKEVLPGLHYNPHRPGDGTVEASVQEMVARFMKQLPVQLLSAQGYLTSTFRTEEGYVLHLLAEEYDTDIDHTLDDMRFHRSRVNFVNKVTPVNVSRTITLRANSAPTVFTPLSKEPATVQGRDGVYEITLPKDTAYAILQFPA